MGTASELARGEQASLGCLFAQFVRQPAIGLGRIGLQRLTAESPMIQVLCALAQVRACDLPSATGHIVLMFALAVVVFECSSGVASAHFLKSSDFPGGLAPFGAVSVRKVTHFRVAMAKEV